MNIIKAFRRFKANLKINEAIKQADQAHAKDGKRYYVMPNGGLDGKLVVMDRYNFRKLKLKHYIPHNVKIMDLERECFYCTAYKNGEGKLDTETLAKKRENYHSWLEVLRKLRKHYK